MFLQMSSQHNYIIKDARDMIQALGAYSNAPSPNIREYHIQVHHKQNILSRAWSSITIAWAPSMVQGLQ